MCHQSCIWHPAFLLHVSVEAPSKMPKCLGLLLEEVFGFGIGRVPSALAPVGLVAAANLFSRHQHTIMASNHPFSATDISSNIAMRRAPGDTPGGSSRADPTPMCLGIPGWTLRLGRRVEGSGSNHVAPSPSTLPLLLANPFFLPSFPFHPLFMSADGGRFPWPRRSARKDRGFTTSSTATAAPTTRRSSRKSGGRASGASCGSE